MATLPTRPVRDANGNVIQVAFEEIEPGIHSQVQSLFTDGAPVSRDNPVAVQPSRSDLVSLSSKLVTSEATVLLLESNAERNGFVIHNNSEDELLISYGVTASELLYSYKMAPGSYVEHGGAGSMTGPVSATRTDGGTGIVMVTEWKRA